MQTLQVKSQNRAMDGHLHFRLSSALRRRIEAEAERDRRTPSALVRIILERALEVDGGR